MKVSSEYSGASPQPYRPLCVSLKEGELSVRARKKGCAQFQRKSGRARNCVWLLVEVGTCIASPEGGKLRQEIAALRLMARQGQGAKEKLLRN